MNRTLTTTQEATQILWRESPGGGTGGSQSSGAGLAPDLVREAASRLAIVCLVYAGVYAISFASGTLLGWVPNAKRGTWTPKLADLEIVAASVFLSLAYWAWIRRSSVATERLLDWSGLYLTFGALGIEMGRFRNWGIGLYDGISWSCVWILFFAVVVPMPRQKATVSALAAATMGPVAYGLQAMVSAIPARTDEVISSLILDFLPNYISAGLAIIASQVVFRLGRDVSRARQMGSYELVERLGTGGMGEVWVARHRMLARPAAIKLVRPEALGTDARHTDRMLQRFEWEAEATAALRSPHTIALYDFGRTDTGLLYYAMEHLQGLDLQRLVERFGPLPPERVVALIDQALQSLGEAHGKGLLHRDIKPSNLFLTEQAGEYDWLKVLDFGLVKKMESTPTQPMLVSQDGAVVGSPLYMAPERFYGDVDADHRSDLYAIGAVAYFLLTGHPVFEAQSPMQALLAQVKSEPESLRSRGVEVSKELDAIVLRCLDKEPKQRFSSAEELRAALWKTPEWGGWTQAEARHWWQANLAPNASTELVAAVT